MLRNHKKIPTFLCAWVFSTETKKNVRIQNIAEYGSWESPLTSNDMVSDSIRINELQCNNNEIYWLEQRPNEGGRYVICNNTTDNIIPSNHNCRSRVHEYGGGSYKIYGNYDNVLHCNFKDQNVFHNNEPLLVNNDDEYLNKYADFDVNGNKIVCVREMEPKSDHNADSVINTIVSIDVNDDGGFVQETLDSEHDFYASPRINPVHSNIVSYIAWDHPNLPWDKTVLKIRDLNDKDNDVIMDTNCNIMELKWSHNGEYLYFISDVTGFWNIYCYDIIRKKQYNLCDYTKSDFAAPMWKFGNTHYDILDDNTIIAISYQNGESKLNEIKLNIDKDGVLHPEILEYELNSDDIAYMYNVVTDKLNKNIYILGGSPTQSNAVFKVPYSDPNNVTKIKESSQTIDKDYISIPKHISFKTTNNDTAYAFIYEPKNPEYKAPDDSLPPLLVMSHGGPTSATNNIYNNLIQGYTTRGWMVADINYRGSTGYGTEYRNKLYGNWGVYDVDDCCELAKLLVDTKQVNPDRLAIRGGSAGGYTTLAALTFKNIFSIGCSLYGVGDLDLLAKGTHKFESQYLYNLVNESLFQKRSPIHYANELNNPVIFLHGDQDKVVPLDQAQTMYNALINNKQTSCLQIFNNEQHGFRIKDNIIKSIDYEYVFYSKLLGFNLSKSDEINMNSPDITYGVQG